MAEVEFATQEDFRLLGDAKRYHYDHEYINSVFIVWYRNGRPGPNKLHRLIGLDPKSNLKPTPPTLDKWIKDNDWDAKASLMDQEVAKELQRTEIARKAHVIQEHAKQAGELRRESFNWILENIGEFTPASAVRLFFEAAQLEKDSIGLDKMLESISNLDDEQLVNQLAEALKGAKIDAGIIDSLLDAEEEDADYNSSRNVPSEEGGNGEA